MKSENRQRGVVTALAFAILLSAFVPSFTFLSEDVDADESGTADYTFYRYSIKFMSTSTDTMYLIWDFADGTILDGRWEYYVKQQNDGATLSQDILDGIDAYKTLLQENGNSIYAPIHTYSEPGIYTYTITAINPVGYVSPESGMPYDGTFSTDTTGFDGGLIEGITVSTYNDADRSISGAWDSANITLDVRGYPVITFDSQGGSTVEPLEVENTDVYSTAIEPVAPSRDGYTFNGWYTDSACTVAYDWSMLVKSDLTLYAGWTEGTDEPIQYTVSFNTNGGSAVASQTIGSGEKATMPTTPTRDGYTFNGWYTDSACTIAYDWNAAVSGNLTLFAKWTANAPVPTGYTVSFNTNGGSAVASQIVDSGQKATMPTAPTRDGYTFNGWYTDSACTIAYDWNVAVSGNITLFAKWVDNATPTDPGTDDSDKVDIAEFVPAILIISGAVVMLIGFRLHPALMVLGLLLVLGGVVDINSILDLFGIEAVEGLDGLFGGEEL